MAESRPAPVTLSPLDEARFGVRTARAMRVTMAILPEVLEFCRVQRVQFLIARCSARDLPVARAMEHTGFELMDTLVYFRCDLQRKVLPDCSGVTIHPVQSEDVDGVRKIAREAFQGYSGHYHADPRLSRAACDDLYVDWAGRSCTQKDVADEVLIAEAGGELLGFLALKVLEDNETDGRLYAVSPRAQGCGIGQALLVNALHWCKEHGIQAMIISTQLTNLVSQISWVRVGFDPYQSFYTFHKWFDGEESSND